MTNDRAFVEGATLPEQLHSSGATGRLGGAIKRHWGQAVVLVLALLVWLPRLSGPIDLRWDAGVYYLLGTSLASGDGYRIPSEPGSPEALQYPPLLPAIVALHERALGTINVAVVAPWLRKFYALLFVGYALAVLALAKRYLRQGFAVAATALCLLYSETIFFSDLLYAELPFALISVAFVLVASGGPLLSRPWIREVTSFALAATGLLLRTAGVALLAAWVIEAFLRRRWWLGVARGALAFLPVLAWQAHVIRVRSSDAYRHPAYEYQRAPYQFNNVSYAENVLLINPFRPELGRVNAGTLAARLTRNLPRMMAALGETVSLKKDGWQWLLQKAQLRLPGRRVIPAWVALIPILLLTSLGVAGLLILAYCGAWLIVLIVLGSAALVWTTPWANQFTRYLVPLAPFLAICTVVGISQLRAWLGRFGAGRGVRILFRSALAGLLVLILAVQTVAAIKVFRQRASNNARAFFPGDSKAAPRFFVHDHSWQALEEASTWIDTHAPSDAIVATSAPHLFYLLTGRLAVIPPLEPDPKQARRLLEEVPVSYVVIDEIASLDMSRRYALPAVASDPKSWRPVHSNGGTTIYERAARP